MRTTWFKHVAFQTVKGLQLLQVTVLEKQLNQKKELKQHKDAVRRVAKALMEVMVYKEASKVKELEKFIDQASMLGATKPVVDQWAPALRVQQARDDAVELLSWTLVDTDIKAYKACYEVAKTAGVDACSAQEACGQD